MERPARGCSHWVARGASLVGELGPGQSSAFRGLKGFLTFSSIGRTRCCSIRAQTKRIVRMMMSRDCQQELFGPIVEELVQSIKHLDEMA